MKTLNEITNGYLSIFERMNTLAIADRLEAAACCDHDAGADHSEEFCACVHCILCSYIITGSCTIVEVPYDVPIILWADAMNYVINWFNDHYVPYDDSEPDDDSGSDYDPSIFCTKATEDVVDTETTEDMMYPDCSSHFITKDMEAEYDPTDDRIDVSCKDCPDDECTGHCMSCYYR